MGLARFQLHASPQGVSLIVNDALVEGVHSVQFVTAPGEVPRLVVFQHAEATPLDGEGVVHVQTAGAEPELVTEAAVKAHLLAWLEQLDGDQLERQALDQQGWGSGGLGNEILDVLKKLAGSIGGE